jgi:hypothetical protein
VQNGVKLPNTLRDQRTKRARTPGRRPLTRARSRASKATRRRITPDDRQLEVRIFLAALAAGKPLREAAKMANLPERRIVRWVAFNGFLPAVKKAQRTGKVARSEAFGDEALAALMELNAALSDRTQQQTADRYAGGDRERLDRMWMSGELMAIYEREAIEALRRHGKHDLADHYERALAAVPPPQPIDYAGEALRSLGLE